MSENWRNIGKPHKKKKPQNGVLSGDYCHEQKSDMLKRTKKEDYLETWKNMSKNCISEWGGNPSTIRYFQYYYWKSVQVKSKLPQFPRLI